MSEPDLKAIEATLVSLTPTSSINRDALLFRAGRASVQRRWVWPAATGVLACVAVLLAAGWMFWPAPQRLHEVHMVVVNVPSEPRVAADRPIAAFSDRPVTWLVTADHRRSLREYQLRQQQLVRWGLDALPNLAPVAAREPSWNNEQLRGTRRIETDAIGWPWLTHFFGSGERS